MGDSIVRACPPKGRGARKTPDKRHLSAAIRGTTMGDRALDRVSRPLSRRSRSRRRSAVGGQLFESVGVSPVPLGQAVEKEQLFRGFSGVENGLSPCFVPLGVKTDEVH